tara:strand:+ start:388 stop:567 length:180 start_codon:yes stop_codon:yes gene_type:complete
MIASITRIGLGKTFVSSLNRIAWDKNQKRGNTPMEITLIPTLKSLLSLISNPLKYFLPF